MQGMLTDYLGQKDEAKEFETFLTGLKKAAAPLQQMADPQFEFQIQCLKTSNWPTYLSINM